MKIEKPQKVKYKTKTVWRRSTVEELLCIIPAVAIMCVCTYYPLFKLFHITFTDWNMLSLDYNMVGTKNWEWFFKNMKGSHFLESLGTTFKYTAGSLATGLIGGLALALLMNRLKNRQFSLMRSFIYLPHYIAMSTGGVIFIWMLNRDYGIVNNILVALFGEGARVNWLKSKDWAMVSIWIAHAWHSLGYSMMIYLSAMTGIDSGYYEAASLDGANRSQKFFRITVPLLTPTMQFLFVTQFLGSMKAFNIIDILTQGGPLRATEVLTYLIYDLGFQRYRFDRSSVISTVFFFILLIFTIVTMQWSEKKVVYDA